VKARQSSNSGQSGPGNFAPNLPASSSWGKRGGGEGGKNYLNWGRPIRTSALFTISTMAMPHLSMLNGGKKKKKGKKKKASLTVTVGSMVRASFKLHRPSPSRVSNRGRKRGQVTPSVHLHLLPDIPDSWGRGERRKKGEGEKGKEG